MTNCLLLLTTCDYECVFLNAKLYRRWIWVRVSPLPMSAFHGWRGNRVAKLYRRWIWVRVSPLLSAFHGWRGKEELLLEAGLERAGSDLVLRCCVSTLCYNDGKSGQSGQNLHRHLRQQLGPHLRLDRVDEEYLVYSWLGWDDRFFLLFLEPLAAHGQRVSPTFLS